MHQRCCSLQHNTHPPLISMWLTLQRDFLNVKSIPVQTDWATPAWCIKPGYRFYMKINLKPRSEATCKAKIGKIPLHSFVIKKRNAFFFFSKIKYSNMSPEGSIHFFCPPCRLKIPEWPSPLFPAWSWNKRNENLLTSNTQGQFFCLCTSSCGAANNNSWGQRENPAPAFQETVLVCS